MAKNKPKAEGNEPEDTGSPTPDLVGEDASPNRIEDSPGKVPSKRSLQASLSMFLLLIGGLVAGFIGYGLNLYGPLAQDNSTMISRLSDLEEKVRELETALDATATSEMVIENQATAEADQAVLSVELQTMDNRLSALEDAQAALSGDADWIAKYDAEMTRLRDLIETFADTEPEPTKSDLTIPKAMSEIAAALENGTPFEAPLSVIETHVRVPQSLVSASVAGVATQSELRATFPDAARAALSASRKALGQDTGIGGFLRTRLQVRSLEIREGNSPDAILSRAQAVLGEGELGHALDEIAQLPEAGQAAMDEWISQATTRHTALETFFETRQSLTSDLSIDRQTVCC